MDQPKPENRPTDLAADGSPIRPGATAEPKPPADPLSLIAVDANELRRRIASGEAGDLNAMIEAALAASDTRNAA